MTLETLVQLLPIYGIVVVIVASLGVATYVGKKSTIQANAAGIFVGSFIALNLKTNLIYGQSPYVILLTAIAIILGLIILNVLIATKANKAKKNANKAETLS